MRDHENTRETRTGTDRAAARTPSPAPQHDPPGLQATVGNAAVVRMLRRAGHPWARDQHQHTASCGDQQNEGATAPVQRSAVHDVLPLQRVATRGATGSLPFPAWDLQPPVWVPAVFGQASNGGPLQRMGGTSVTVTLGPSVNAPRNTYGGSPPAATECTLVDELRARDGGGWVRGHLWNDNLGGEGVSRNLTPMTDSTNQNFGRQFEEPLKKMLRKCTDHARQNPNSPVWYGVTFTVGTYGRMSTNPADLEYLVPEGVEYTASYVQMDKVTNVITQIGAPQGFPPVIT